MKNSKYEQYTTDYISGVMSLRAPQKKSLEILDDIILKTNLINEQNADVLEIINSSYPICSDFERNFISLTFALATGVGKTRLMGAFITYLYTNYNIKNFLVVAPNTTIYDKLKKDLGYPENPKYVFNGVGCFNNPPKIVADDDYANRNISLFESDITIYVYNISKFDKDNTKMKSFNEVLGMSFYDKLAKMDDLVIIMDESHHYRADRGMEAINNLKPVLGLELTATPIVNVSGRQVPFKNVVYEYPLSMAIKDGFTRVPFAVTRTDVDFYDFGNEELDKLMLNDGIICHKKIKEKLEYYAKSTKKPLVKPFMLVVCKDTEHASKVENYIKSNEFENGYYKYKTITINSKVTGAESDYNTKLLLEVENVNNPIEIVIHVNMLKEGWDVNNLYTIVPLRTASSKILREQMIGRGLRLPYGKRTGNKDIDAVMLTAHDKFQEIIDEAQRGDSIFNKGNVILAEELENEKITYSQIAIEYPSNNELNDILEIHDENVKYGLTNKLSDLLIKNVEDYIYNTDTEVKDISSDDINKIEDNIINEIKSNTDFGEIFEENKNPIEHWIKENITKTHELSMNKFILIPKIKVESEDGEYYFEDFDIDLSKFEHKPIENEILLRSLIDSSDEEKMDGGYINFDASNPKKVILDILRNKPEIDYEENADLLHKIINSVLDKYEEKYNIEGVKNIVMMYKKDITDEIYKQMVKHFVKNTGLIKEEVFSENIMNIKPNYSYNIIKNIFEPFNSERDGKITSVLFDGIKNGVFSSAKFDSEPELILARQLEREEDFVCKWLRPATNEFNITYNNGKKYVPDFVVETSSTVYLVEVKADNQLESDDVLAKKERAISYCELVSKWKDYPGNKRWQYIFIPSSRINSNSTFRYLAEQYKEN